MNFPPYRIKQIDDLGHVVQMRHHDDLLHCIAVIIWIVDATFYADRSDPIRVVATLSIVQ